MGNKKNILFVTRKFGMGGDTSALISILNSSLAEIYDIDVFEIFKTDYTMPVLDRHDIGLNTLTSALYSDIRHLNGKAKIAALLVKPLCRIKQVNSFLQNVITRQTISRIEKHKKYDIVVAYLENDATHFVKEFANPKKIAWIHCDYAHTYGNTRNEFSIYDAFTNIVCVSDFTRDSFSSVYPQLRDRVVSINNIFDISSILQKAKEPVDDVRFLKSELTIISVGRISEVKQFSKIPVIARKLRNHGLVFKWYVLGAIYEQEAYDEFMGEINKYDVSEYVIYLGGKKNPYSYFREADLLVVLSKSEACPMIFNEAKILGLPSITTNFGSSYEFIENGVNGVITDLDSIPDEIIKFHEKTSALSNIDTSSLMGCNPNDAVIDKMKELFNK